MTPDTPVKPDTNGDSGQDKPAPATPTPNADQVDTKTTVDNGAKSNDSQMYCQIQEQNQMLLLHL